MGSYELRFKASVAKELRRLPRRDVQRIWQRIEQLGEDPRPPGAVKLSTSELYRIRQGRYRIVYEIIDQQLVIVVVRVGHRGTVYRPR